VESDLRLKGKQAISELKKEIRQVCAGTFIGEDLGHLMKSEEFLRGFIVKVVEAWQKEGELEIHLPAHLAEELSDHFTQKLLHDISSVNITFSERLKDGFRISTVDDRFELSFTEDDFMEFFRPYLNDTTDKLIFGN